MQGNARRKSQSKRITPFLEPPKSWFVRSSDGPQNLVQWLARDGRQFLPSKT
jgi:hypothetical protein